MKLKQKRALAVTAGIIFVTLMLLFGRYTKGLISDVDRFAAWLRGLGTTGEAVMVLLVVAQVILAVVPGGPFQIAAGYVYGPVRGTVLCILGCTAGSMISFLLVRRYGRRVIALFFGEDQMKTFDRIAESPRWKAVLPLLFLIPGSPKDLMSYAAGLTDLPAPLWILIASAGRLPAIILSAVSGSAVQKAEYGKAAAVLALICVISAAGGFLYHRYVQTEAGPERKNASTPDAPGNEMTTE